MSQVSTCSLNEAMYLLRRGNRVVGVRRENPWPAGQDECAIVFEGAEAEADHDSYFRGVVLPLAHRLPELFAAITEALQKDGAS